MTTYWLTGRRDAVLDEWDHRRLVCWLYQRELNNPAPACATRQLICGHFDYTIGPTIRNAGSAEETWYHCASELRFSTVWTNVSRVRNKLQNLQVLFRNNQFPSLLYDLQGNVRYI